MKSKILLAFLLFTPPLVLLISTLSFQSGFSPINTKNNGVFFSEYFDVKDLNLINDKKVGYIKYEKMADGLNKIILEEQNIYNDVFAEVEKLSYQLEKLI